MPSLFRELGLLAESNGQRENQLSRTFAAAFNHSAPFRSALVPFVVGRFGLRMRTASSNWHCRYEEPARSGNGRLDLVLSPRDHDHRTRSREVIVLENKVDAKLTWAQLSKYRPQHAHIGVITARYPEVPAARLRKERIPAFRWHEIHGALLNTPARERDWIIAEFITYLEDKGMASRGLTRKDLLGIRSTLNLVGGPINRYRMHDLRFDKAAVAKAFVEDIAHAVSDALADRGVRLWGPGYGKVDYDEGQGVLHQFGFSIRSRSTRGAFPCVDYALIFPAKKRRTPYAWVGFFGRSRVLESEFIWSGSELFDRGGRLLEDRHTLDVARTCRRLVRYLKQ